MISEENYRCGSAVPKEGGCIRWVNSLSLSLARDKGPVSLCADFECHADVFMFH
jgi:hypothetical protein